MHTYAVLAKLLLQLSVPLGLLVSLCMLAARMRGRGAQEDDDGDTEAEAEILPGRIVLWAGLCLVFLALHLLLARWLWQASASGQIISCGAAGCLNTFASLENDSLAFWGSAALYWLACIVAPLVYLYPLACWLRNAWRARRTQRDSFADTEPVEPHW